MASRCRRSLRPALQLALAVLSCLHLALPSASSQLSSPLTTTRPLPRPAATTPTTTTTPLKPDSSISGEIAGGAGDVGDRGVVGRACTYTVEIKTSCSSPRRSTDAVSLAFGDVYRNEVYAARVTPARGFERCAKDTFRVAGPCGYGVCYLYLRRTAGGVGWTPEWVRVYEPTSSTPSTFYFGDPLPNGVWYGTDRCLRRAASSSEPAAAAQAL